MAKYRIFLSSLFIFCFIIVSNYKLYSQNDDIRTRKITENIYNISGAGGNVAFIVTKNGVMVIDSKISPFAGEKIIDEIRKITDKDIKYLIYTHYHGDHIQGAQSFPPEAVLISHPNTAINIENISIPRMKAQINMNLPKQISETEKEIQNLNNQKMLLKNTNEQELDEKRIKEKILNEKNTDEKSATLKAEEQWKNISNMQKRGMDSLISEKEKELETLKNRLKEMSKIDLRKPQVLVSKDTLIKFGGEDIQLFFMGNGHTNGDLMVYFVNHKVLHTGDLLFNKIIPYIDSEAGCNTWNWMDIMERLMAMDVIKVIPGHGDITDKGSFMEQGSYLNDLRTEIQKYIENKESLQEIKKELQMLKYAEWIGYKQRFSRNIETVYRELTKEK